MKILKNILIALGIILVIAAIGIYFLPKQFSIPNSIEINRPVAMVYAQVGDFNNWAKWSPWAEMEPTAKTTVEGTPGMKGHKMSWDGEKLGQGSLSIAWTKANETIHCDLDFLKPFKAHDKDVWDFESSGPTTCKVTWTTSGGLKYPLGRLFGLSVNSMMDKEHNKGLDNLKKYIESMPEPPVASADSTASADTKPM